jgi:A/G-specific adenine glycosylase
MYDTATGNPGALISLLNCESVALPSRNSISFLQKKLLTWFDQHGRKFPWRKDNLSNYELIIAEVLLQRTRAETVAKFYDKFIEAFPNWKSLTEAKLLDIQNFLVPIGLYRQRAHRLQNLAKEMVRRKYKLPRQRDELENIPFFGQYMANAVNLLVFKEPSPLIDVNMARVLERFFENRKLADIRYDHGLQDLAHRVVMVPQPENINWAILDFAALVCKARRPACENCPLSEQCTFIKTCG